MAVNKGIIISLLFCIITLFPCVVYAGIGAKPFFYEFEGSSGDTINGVYSVYNTGDTEIAVEVYFKDHYKLEENKDIFAKDWLTCDLMEFNLGPKQTKDIKFTAHVPEGVVGEIMGMIYFSAGSSPGSNVKMSYGVPVYVKMKDTAKVKGNIKDVRIEKVKQKPKYVPEHYKVLVLLENEGNVHIRPKIKVNLYKDSKSVKTVSFQFGKPVFPNGSHNYTSTWELKELEITQGIYIVEAEVSFNNEVLKKETRLKVDEDGNIQIISEGDKI